MRHIIFALPGLLALAACDGGTQGAGVTEDDTGLTQSAEATGEPAAQETAAPDPAE